MNTLSPFDILADTYDADFTTSSIGLLQRERVWHYLSKLLATMGEGLRILEINCGTGEDAIKLASLGHTVIATDASKAMIEKANLKNNRSVDFQACSFNNLKDQFKQQQFDLVFSNFGGLNCIDRKAMEALGNDLTQLLKPAGKLFFVVLSDCCIWELFYFGLRAKFKTAFRRFKASTPFKIGNNILPVYYYSPKGLRKILSRSYKPECSFPVGLFIPPSYLQERYNTRPQQLNRLARWENKFGRRALSRFADHYCSIFTKHTSA